MGSSKSKAVLLHGIYIRVTECHAVSSPTDVDGIQTDSSLSTVTQWLSYSTCNRWLVEVAQPESMPSPKLAAPCDSQFPPEIDPKETFLVAGPAPKSLSRHETVSCR